MDKIEGYPCKNRHTRTLQELDRRGSILSLLVGGLRCPKRCPCLPSFPFPSRPSVHTDFPEIHFNIDFYCDTNVSAIYRK